MPVGGPSSRGFKDRYWRRLLYSLGISQFLCITWSSAVKSSPNESIRGKETRNWMPKAKSWWNRRKQRPALFKKGKLLGVSLKFGTIDTAEDSHCCVTKNHESIFQRLVLPLHYITFYSIITLHCAKETLSKLACFFDWRIRPHRGVVLSHDS